MPLFSLDRSPTLVGRPYSPQRAMRLGGLAGAGSLLAVVGVMVSGGGSSAGNSAATTDAIDPGVSVVTAAETLAVTVLPTAQPTTTAPTTVPTTTLAPATTLAAPVCTNTYTVVAGDYWVLIADEASISVEALYAANNATSATALFPGQTVCLPDGSTVVVTTAPAVTSGTAAAPKTTTKTTTNTTTNTTVAPAPVATTPNTSSHSSG